MSAAVICTAFVMPANASNVVSAAVTGMPGCKKWSTPPVREVLCAVENPLSIARAEAGLDWARVYVGVAATEEGSAPRTAYARASFEVWITVVDRDRAASATLEVRDYVETADTGETYSNREERYVEFEYGVPVRLYAWISARAIADWERSGDYGGVAEISTYLGGIYDSQGPLRYIVADHPVFVPEADPILLLAPTLAFGWWARRFARS